MASCRYLQKDRSLCVVRENHIKEMNDRGILRMIILRMEGWMDGHMDGWIKE